MATVWARAESGCGGEMLGKNPPWLASIRTRRRKAARGREQATIVELRESAGSRPLSKVAFTLQAPMKPRKENAPPPA